MSIGRIPISSMIRFVVRLLNFRSIIHHWKIGYCGTLSARCIDNGSGVTERNSQKSRLSYMMPTVGLISY
jgi:hypothetical protein